jgi:hypothetical protein
MSGVPPPNVQPSACLAALRNATSLPPPTSSSGARPFAGGGPSSPPPDQIARISPSWRSNVRPRAWKSTPDAT